MELEYKILWIDDEDMTSQINRIERYISLELGFVPKIIKCKSEREMNDKKINFEDFDLILLDFQLNSGKTTDNILKRVKEKTYCSEICFYSSKGTFIEHIKDNLEIFEGVFFEEGREGLITKIKEIIKLTLKKIQDLNNLRGLVMAETADLDILKREIIHLAYKKKLIDEKFFKTEVFESLKKDYWNKYLKIKKNCGYKIKNDYSKEKISEYFFDDIYNKFMDSFFFDCERKIRILTKILKKYKTTHHFNDTDYRTNIQQKRNKLAHVAKIKEKEKIVLKDRNNPKNDLVFDDQVAKKMREKTKEYRKLFNNIKEEIEKM